MSNQEIFETLAKLEAELFYRDVAQGKDRAAHAVLREAVAKFAEVTGCRLS